MSANVITTVLTPAASYNLTTLANVKLDCNINAGMSFTTSADTPSGLVLPFASTYGIAKGQTVSGVNIAPGATVQAVGNTSVTLSAAVLGDVPAGSAILFNADSSTDAFLTRAIAQASMLITNYCNYAFPAETIQDQFNFLNGYYPCQTDGSLNKLQLSKFPLISVTSVVVNEAGTPTTLVLGTDFLADNDNGVLLRLDTNGNPRPWDAYQTVVIYVAGYAVIPMDIDDAASRLTKLAFWARGRDPSLMEQNTSQMGSQRYWVNQDSLPPQVSNILDNYRVPVTA